jgi:hypothetical protein
MLIFTKKQLYRAGWDRVTYKSLREEHVLDTLLSAEISMAVQAGASRITWGLPPGVELTDADKADIRSRDEVAKRVAGSARETFEHHAPEATEKIGVTFHRRDELPEVPAWLLVDGRWSCVPGVPAWTYPYLPQYLTDRLVSLGKKRFEGGMEEWIEYGMRWEEERRFARVDVVLEANTSVTVELLETRVEPKDAVVWWRHWRA